MFQGQYLFSDNAVLSPWMSRGGDNLKCTFEVIQHNNADLTVECITKKREDAGPGGKVGPTLTIDTSVATTGEGTWDAVNKDLVRFRFTCVSEGTPAVTDFVLFRSYSPVWTDAVDGAAVTT